jgi:hypothetical protein
MQNISLDSYIGADGILLLKVPFTPNEANLKVKVTIQPVTSESKSPEELGYPPGFFGEVIGGWVGEPLIRASPGEFEQRESLK